MNNSLVAHKSDSLVITIPTANAAAMHHLLLKGINDAVEYYLGHPDPGKNTDGLQALLKLQEHLLPKETELQKAYE